ncbi:hypothetical protein COU88_00880 [Candidatus Roizmanbacteria bacterium CG10_big_fil_rev_8_21_14_0_10_39_6]|uniref:Uncharacterized protein n=1 Tax=Candidatus Roizmanbacteria bacterium CG10_big_fil_rev_8_21_14_0_10_39_6 TaxID=1974853 RepID=A0A2M8KTD8_9BACT|nr:MAG: hypothetical protein COU88_00880 [Candidatus Roizmanbacteria bacterium CG10_big_fil_rev_8_21_14_0_10_39_6]
MIKLILPIISGIIAAFLYESVARIFSTKVLHRTELVIWRYKLHHSLFALPFFAIYGLNKKMFFLGFGIGILLQHAVTDGFRFIQKV